MSKRYFFDQSKNYATAWDSFSGQFNWFLSGGKFYGGPYKIKIPHSKWIEITQEEFNLFIDKKPKDTTGW
jgi:hypothetical protein